jgi:hypothetical protein
MNPCGNPDMNLTVKRPQHRFTSICHDTMVHIRLIRARGLRVRGLGVLRNAHFRVRPINLPQRIADFTHSRVGANCINDVRHGVGGGEISV